MCDFDVFWSARGMKLMDSERGCIRFQRIQEILKEKNMELDGVKTLLPKTIIFILLYEWGG